MLSFNITFILVPINSLALTLYFVPNCASPSLNAVRLLWGTYI